MKGSSENCRYRDSGGVSTRHGYRRNIEKFLQKIACFAHVGFRSRSFSEHSHS